MIAGHSTQDIERLLGHGGRATVIHRDDLVLFGREIPEARLTTRPAGVIHERKWRWLIVFGFRV